MTTTTTHEVGRRDCDACNGSGLQRGNPTGTNYTHPDDVETTCGACDGAGEWATCPRCHDALEDEVPGCLAYITERWHDAGDDRPACNVLHQAIEHIEHVARTGQCWACDAADREEREAVKRRAAIHVASTDRTDWCMCCARSIARTAPAVVVHETDRERNIGSHERIICVQCALRIEAALGEHQAVAS